MWIFLSDGFLSIVEYRDDPAALLVRARAPGHIEATFPSAAVIESREADYHYRAVIPREQVAKTLADRVRQIDYANFRSSIEDSAYHNACFFAWRAMADYQDRHHIR